VGPPGFGTWVSCGGCALGLLEWLVGHHASVTLGSFSIIAFGTCCIIKCLLWLLLAIIACVVGVVFVPAFVVPYKSNR
jgi:hypothetical protein